MKNFTILPIVCLLLLINISAFSQQVGINADGSSPDNSAILDVKSIDKGTLFPRMTNAEMLALPSPATGLVIFNTTTNCVYFHSSVSWTSLCAVPSFVCGTSTVDDIDGNTYNTVLIGSQCWLKEDLKVGTYPNGNPIPYIDKNTTWGALADDNTSDAFTVYGDNNNDGVVKASGAYGYLYSYAAAIGDNWARDNVANQGICPDGWHLPTDTEWLTLENTIETGGAILAATTGMRGTDVGERLKEAGTSHWNTGAGANANSSLFTALPGGYRHFGAANGASANKKDKGFWWCASENGNTGWIRSLGHYNSKADRTALKRSHGFSVRCVKD